MQSTAYTLVRPILEYISRALDPHTKTDAKTSKQLQISCYRLITHNYRREPGEVSNILRDLKLVPLEERRAKRLCMMYKIANKLIDIPMNKHLRPAQTKTRGSHSHKFPSTTSSYYTYKYSYSPGAITNWNSLKDETVKCPSLDSFKWTLQHV